MRIYANSHYVTPRPTLNQAVKEIRAELRARLAEMEAQGKLLEAQTSGAAHQVTISR